ncbi:MAG: tetratricopeptide repeat protein, partial [Pseudonocardiaceae bacterium]
MDRALDHEIRHWRARINEVDHPLLERCVALVTLAGARDDAEAEALFALVPELAGEPATASRRRLDRWLRGLYEGPDRWNPLRPDRLGEALITRTLWADEGGLALLSTTLDLRSNAQLTQALEVLLHLAADNGTEEIVATALVQRHAALVGRCTEQACGTPQRPGRTGLLDGLARLHTKLLTDHRVATLPTPTQAALSISADALGDLAREHGRSTQAQAIFQGVLVIDERKHELEPGNTTYRRDLSISYNKLADLALAAGRSADAEHLYRQSLQVREELTELEPGNTTYRRDLSISYERLADLALAAGRSADAEHLYRQSLQVREELTEL